ncbi:MAG: GntR family transcriptional regulator, transcriptional repressor for pyruvate dehydrogenase complex [Candidatus Eremiobacteraeota bacterium]|jgi:DNA-binding FadR family transcriptional regulator|nr:GntR family transcriptional regulator, transcriptional repressor for pyruvate dehydrogenase complex [Candidatus Eremiobacteraeota bacterium]
MDAIGIPRRLHAHVVDALMPMIASGELPPGSLLPTEPEMSARFGVSRSVVREALRVLGAKGLIEVRHGSGTRVTTPDRWDPLDPQILGALRGRGPSAAVLHDLLEARTIIECEVAALAAERADAEQRDALRDAVETMRASLDDPERFVSGDSAFHLTLLRAARNRVLERMTQPMHELLRYAQALTDAIPGVLTRALADHEAIAEAVLRRDAAGARDAMRVHLAQTQRDIIAITEAK